MANLKFLKGLYERLNQTSIVEGQILITKDTREMFVDVDASTRIKIGDFTVVDSIAALEALDATKVPTSRLYYVANGNILARSNGTSWVQINKQPTAEELKTLLGLGSLAYKSEVAEDDLNADLKAKVNASAEAKHSHDNKDELDKIADGDVAKWNAVVADHLTSTDKTALEDAIADVNTAVENEAKAARAAEKANADAITAIKDGTTVDSFADVETELAKKVEKEEGKSLVSDTEITKLAGVSEGANKVEASENNGNIKIDGVETTVYTHPAKHAIADIEGLQDALDGKQGSGDFAAEDHTHTKADITDFEHTHTASEVTDLTAAVMAMELITTADIDTICGNAIEVDNGEVTF